MRGIIAAPRISAVITEIRISVTAVYFALTMIGRKRTINSGISDRFIHAVINIIIFVNTAVADITMMTCMNRNNKYCYRDDHHQDDKQFFKFLQHFSFLLHGTPCDTIGLYHTFSGRQIFLGDA